MPGGDDGMISIEQVIRVLHHDFEALPFPAADYYRYCGSVDTHASVAVNRATRLANPTFRPTVINLPLSVLIALLEEYTGS
jgi:hypothetical protein